MPIVKQMDTTNLALVFALIMQPFLLYSAVVIILAPIRRRRESWNRFIRPTEIPYEYQEKATKSNTVPQMSSHALSWILIVCLLMAIAVPWTLGAGFLDTEEKQNNLYNFILILWGIAGLFGIASVIANSFWIFTTKLVQAEAEAIDNGSFPVKFTRAIAWIMWVSWFIYGSLCVVDGFVDLGFFASPVDLLPLITN